MLNFIFCIHIHQPVGNFDFVIEDAYKDAYLPFLAILSKYPSIKLSLHISGYLLDWLNENHREYLDLLKTMINRGQVEMMGGGYYEPVLTVIPKRDRIGQIKLMSLKLHGYFGVRPNGIWLTERVWEPHLPESLKEAGVEYVVVDDYHFVKAGMKKEDLSGYYLTEEQGAVLKVFPGSEKLRYIIPFKPVEKFIGHLKELENQGGNASCSPLIVFADDGEKFGVWPGTYNWAYKEGWLERFLEALNHNLEWIKPVTFSEYIKDNEPSGRVYLPTTSYMEMGEWALPAEASLKFANLANDVKTWHDGERVKRFLQGGMWRNFMAKYSEANWMHKRMLMVSKELITENSDQGRMYLYKAQANDAYWHGVFGGLYLPHLRSAVYENLIKAENLFEADVKNPGRVSVCEEDFDSDTHNEILLRTQRFNIFLKPHCGGSIQELDYRPNACNITNVLTRRYEGYHHRVKTLEQEARGEETKSIHDIVVSKEQGLEKSLVYDKYERRSLIDHFIKPDVTLDALQAGDFEECGDFVNAKYNSEVRPVSAGAPNPELRLSRSGRVFNKSIRVEKRIQIAGDSLIKINYLLANVDGAGINILFCSEWNILIGFGLKARDMGVMGEFEIQEDWLGLKFRMKLNPLANLYIYPIETVSFSEAGFEKNFQGLCILPCWEINLEPGNTWENELSVEILGGF